MNIGQLITLIRSMIAEAKAGNYLAAFLTLVEIVQAIGGAFPQVLEGKSPPKMRASTTNYDTMTVDELLDAAEDCCKKHSTVGATEAVSAPPSGPFIDAILPILLALLKKWLGF